MMLALPPINYPKFVPLARDVFTTQNALKSPSMHLIRLWLKWTPNTHYTHNYVQTYITQTHTHQMF